MEKLSDSLLIMSKLSSDISFHIIHQEFKKEIVFAKRNINFNITPVKEFTKIDCWKEVDDLVVKLNDNLRVNKRRYSINLNTPKFKEKAEP
jgi:hypothetical protein